MNIERSSAAALTRRRKLCASSGGVTVNSSSAWSIVSRSHASREPAAVWSASVSSASAGPGSEAAKRSRQARHSSGLPERLGRGAGEFADGVVSRPERRQHDPVPPVALEPGQHAGPHQRRLARAGGAEQRDELRRALDAARIEPLDQPAHVVVAAEIDRGVLGLERQEARIGRPALVPGEAALRVERDLGQLAGELGEAALAVAAKVELLDVGGDEALAARRDDHREDRLAERAGLGELGEAPLRFEPVRRQHQDDGMGAVDLLVEGAFPVGAGLDAGMLVDVEEGLVEAVRPEPDHDLGRDVVVEARMGDEDARHRPLLAPANAARRGRNETAGRWRVSPARHGSMAERLHRSLSSAIGKDGEPAGQSGGDGFDMTDDGRRRFGIGPCAAGLFLLLAAWTGAAAIAGDGAWKERSQLVWDASAGKLTRQTLRAWDPHPELGLDFVWEADGAAPTAGGDHRLGPAPVARQRRRRL